MAEALKKYRVQHDEDEQPSRVSTVAIKHGDHVLLGKRRDNGKWTTPGGHLESGEDHHAGALREVLEESGVELEPHEIRPVGPVRNITKPDGGKLRVQGFIANVKKRPPTSMSDDPDAEVHRWQWVDVSKGLPEHIKNDLHVPLEDNVLRNELGHPSEGEDMKGPMLKKYMAHKMAGGEEEHTADVHNDEAGEIGAEGEPHGDDTNLHAQLKEKKGDKYKIPREHANLLGMEDEEDCY